MRNITFIFKQYVSGCIPITNQGIRIGTETETEMSTVGDYVMKLFHVNPNTNDQLSIDTKIYIGKLLIDETLKCCDIERFLKCNHVVTTKINMKNKELIRFTAKRTETLTKFLTKIQLNEPIIKFLTGNNIPRRCWMYNDTNVNIKKTFNDHGIEYPYIGHDIHKECNMRICDLFTYTHSCMGIESHFHRFEESDIYFQNTVRKLCLPLISNRQQIIETFLGSHDDKKLLPSDVDLYFFQMRKKHSDNDNDPLIVIEYFVALIMKNDDFGLKTFVENDNDSCDMESRHVMYGYEVVCKSITFHELKSVMTYVIDNLCEIVYQYLDNKSISPDPFLSVNESKIRENFGLDDHIFSTERVFDLFDYDVW